MDNSHYSNNVDRLNRSYSNIPLNYWNFFRELLFDYRDKNRKLLLDFGR